MADEKLGSFKIGNAGRPGMAAPVQKGGKTEEQQSQEASLGFARIERLLEQEDPLEVGKSLNEILAKLESYADGAKTNKDKLAAQKASAAVERAVDLVDYLFQTKAQLEHGES